MSWGELLLDLFWIFAPGLIPGVTLLALAWVVGGRRERAHLARLDRGEAEMRGVRALTVTVAATPPTQATGAAFVSGGVVVGSDLFKRWRAGVRSLFGGRVVHYETMMERARREAVLRLKRDAHARGSSLVLGVRLQTSTIGGGGGGGEGGGVAVEVFAFGTAVGVADTTLPLGLPAGLPAGRATR